MTARPDGHLRRLLDDEPPGLDAFSTADLVTGLLHRIRAGEPLADMAAPLERLQVLAMELEIGGNHPNNRFSRQRLGQTFWTAAGAGVDLRDATVVEIGAGSLHPLGAGFLFLLAGARRAIAVEPESPQDPVSAIRALAHLAGWVLTDPRLVVDQFPLTREEVCAHVQDFDLGKLLYADASGIPDGRLELLHEGVADLSIEDGACDIAVSVSTLEHLSDLDAAVAELARITRSGGVGSHTIDAVDHRHYGDPAVDPLGFLEVEPDSPLVAECNRVRPVAFCERFERHGFEVVHFEPHSVDPVTESRRRRFVEPFCSMSLEDLSVTRAGLRVRKR